MLKKLYCLLGALLLALSFTACAPLEETEGEQEQASGRHAQLLWPRNDSVGQLDGVSQQCGWYLPSSVDTGYYFVAVDLEAVGAPAASGIWYNQLTFTPDGESMNPNAAFSISAGPPEDAAFIEEYNGFLLYKTVERDGETVPWQEEPLGDRVEWHCLLPLEDEYLCAAVQRAQHIEGFSETGAVHGLLDSVEVTEVAAEEMVGAPWLADTFQTTTQAFRTADEEWEYVTAYPAVLPAAVLRIDEGLALDLNGWNMVTQTDYMGVWLDVVYRRNPVQINIFTEDIGTQMIKQFSDAGYTEVEIKGVPLWKMAAEYEGITTESYLYVDGPAVVSFAPNTLTAPNPEFNAGDLLELLIAG